MKQFSVQNWVGSACEKNSTRDYLQSPYRHDDRLVATDGNRLHLAEGLESVGRPYMLNTLLPPETPFPDYNLVIPTNTRTLGLIGWDRDLIQALKAAKKHNETLVGKIGAKRGRLGRFKILVAMIPKNLDQESITHEVDIAFVDAPEQDYIKISPSYLLDAMETGYPMSASISTEGRHTGPLLLKVEQVNGIKLTAAIMPISL